MNNGDKVLQAIRLGDDAMKPDADHELFMVAQDAHEECGVNVERMTAIMNEAARDPQANPWIGEITSTAAYFLDPKLPSTRRLGTTPLIDEAFETGHLLPTPPRPEGMADHIVQVEEYGPLLGSVLVRAFCAWYLSKVRNDVSAPTGKRIIELIVRGWGDAWSVDDHRLDRKLQKFSSTIKVGLDRGVLVRPGGYRRAHAERVVPLRRLDGNEKPDIERAMEHLLLRLGE